MERSGRPLYVLGLCYSHDASVALVRDGVPVVAIQLERLSRRKHDGSSRSIDLREPIEYCLETEGITLSEVALAVENSPTNLYCRDRHQILGLNAPRFLDGLAPDRIAQVSHHLAHAYLAYHTSPFSSCACLVIDGQGNYVEDLTEVLPADERDQLDRYDIERQSVYVFDEGGCRTLRKDATAIHKSFSNVGGLGHLYETVASYIFSGRHDSGKLMGLAPFGVKAIDMLSIDDAGRLRFPADWIDRQQHEAHPDPEQFKARFKEYADLAASAQAAVELGALSLARWAREASGQSALVLSGGVALNCVANRMIRDQSGFTDLFITPPASDAGISLGAAYYGYSAILGGPRTTFSYSDYLGRQYTDEEIASSLSGLDGCAIVCPDDLATSTARLLADGQVGGWFVGRSEFGPRALGHRSILADPRSATMRRYLNSRIKRREGFRPFAPLVLADRAGELFDLDWSPFMLETATVSDQWRDRLKAVTHVDGTARIQTVDPASEPLLHRVIEEFGRLTGVPALLNTSFNGRSEPIVERPVDAVRSFAHLGLDFLAMSPFLITSSRVRDGGK